MATHPKLRDVTLDDRSLAYLDRVLKDGGDLSHAVLERLHRRPFRVHTLLPAHVDDESAYSFGDAIISTIGLTNPLPLCPPVGAAFDIEQVGAVFDALLDTVIRHLESGPDAICLVEHIWGSAADRWIQAFDFVTQRKGVLLFLTPNPLPRHRDKSTLATTVRTAITTLFLVHDPDWPTWLIRGGSVWAARLRIITRSRLTAVTRAYDDEGYVYLDLE